MLACWKCNRKVIARKDGWICPSCGQHGPPFVKPVSSSWRVASKLNTPYELPTEVGMTYFFFYGIFKSGGYYARKFVGCDQLGPAKAPGFVILRNTGPAAMIPGKSYDENTVAKGTIMAVPDDQLADTLEFLDKVESNGRGYIRVKIEAELDSGRIVEAYAYLWMDYYCQLQSDEISLNGNWYGGFTGFRHVHN